MQDSFSHADAMSAEAWQHLERLAREVGLGDAEMAGLAIGCPWHGDASMDFDENGVFCHCCESGQS
jgi:hypothetical protein